MMLFIQSAVENGYTPTVEEADTYGDSPTRRFTRSPGSLASALMNMGHLTTTMFGQVTGEDFTEYLARIRWASVSGGRIRLTPLGAAMLRAANAESVDDEDALIQTAVLEPTDPFAYARTLGTIADLPSVLVVDPYIKLEGVIDLSAIESVSRILTGDEGKPITGKTVPFGAVAATTNREYEIRVAPNARMHDRYLIPESGPVRQISSSLNSVGRRIGVITHLSDAASLAVRAECEDIWNDATQVPTELTAVDNTEKPKRGRPSKVETDTP